MKRPYTLYDIGRGADTMPEGKKKAGSEYTGVLINGKTAQEIVRESLSKQSARTVRSTGWKDRSFKR